jgi:hypothetical protein
VFNTLKEADNAKDQLEPTNSTGLWMKVGALHFVTSIIATIAGAVLYKDSAKPAVA